MKPERETIQNTGAAAFRPLLLSIMLATGLALGFGIRRVEKDKFSQIFDIIENDYVDSTRRDLLEEQSINNILAGLDPHSSYIPPQLTELSERQIRGNYQGLGIEYIHFNDTLFVYNVFPGGPAEKAGIRAGDRLLRAGSTDLTDSLTRNEIQSAILGKEGSTVAISLFRRSSGEYLDFQIPRATIVMNSSEVYYMAGKTLAYIRLERFSANTHTEFMKALEELRAQGMKDLIVDLRNNGGGLLTEASAIANEFLQKDDVISFTYGFRRKKHYYRADGNGRFKEGKLILLINHNTASASEILAGALQDNDRAVILGNRSFGKGLVQEPFRLSDGSMLRLTISRYYTPSGRSIQKSYEKDIEAYRNEIYVRDQFSDTLNPVHDPKVRKEFFSRNGRLLTAGGGIRPDVFLRDTISDSTEIEMLMPGLFYSRIFDIYVLDHLFGKMKTQSRVYKDIGDFQDHFQIGEDIVRHFIGVASKLSYLRNLKSSPKTNALVRKHLKAALAYRLYGDRGYSLIINREEGVFSKSMEVLKNYRSLLNIGGRKTRTFDY